VISGQAIRDSLAGLMAIREYLMRMKEFSSKKFSPRNSKTMMTFLQLTHPQAGTKGFKKDTL